MKNSIISILKQNQNKLITGSYIAKKLNITRSYVNKVILSLIDEGYDIENISRSGYIYKANFKILDKKYIENNISKKVEIFDEIDSTNNYLKNLAKDKSQNNILVVANYQTNGRGRLGRTFISDKSNGIYMSLLVRPNISINDAKKITCLTAVSINNAINELTGLNSKIKWVNDIYINNKKVCGILTEAQTSIEEGIIDYVVIGIGINVYKREFDESIKNIATSLEDEGATISRNELIIQIIMNIDKYLNNFTNNIYMKEYQNSSCIVGKEVELNIRGDKFKATVLKINDEGELVVRTLDNEELTVYSGEITRLVLNDK
jgi:BirA family biotin operon repressor/biotin-[acetyl-CoA-carboxylase] ligase